MTTVQETLSEMAKDLYEIGAIDKETFLSQALPETLKKYFWDCDFKDLAMDKYAFFITERILNFGNMDSLNWLLDRIDRDFLKEVVKKSRNLDKKTRNFWELMLYDK
jgi:hypothetical protein